jgi:hypothetical protein
MYFSSNITRMSNSRMGWLGHEACMGVRNSYKILVENLKVIDNLGNLVIDGRIILEC